ncbi:hypothetical protein ACMD2_05216 [Ananas comosus]|uniref:Uncharacterized protein n=1 Tax=Ananas comosus TaxID=4615 RepID=A0A199USL0_ANACO|nr:hypothetical protein ACMD2_05216 [Ananas comosus]
MEEVWSWMASLPSSPSWPASLVLAASDHHSILLLADRTAHGDPLLTFSLLLRSPHLPPRTLWLSRPSSSSSSSSHLLLLLLHQLLAESISLSPSTTAPSVGLAAEPVSKALDAAREQGAAFMELALLLRLFWLCAADAPADAGFLFFRALGPSLERAPRRCARALGAFLRAAGPDLEERCARSLGYMLAKWCLLRRLQFGLGEEEGEGEGDSPSPSSPSPLPLPPARPRRRRRRGCCCFAYAAEAHGLWLLRGFAPVPAMARVRGCSTAEEAAPPHDAKDAALRYALAHQQLEAAVQLEYSVSMRDPRFILVGVRVVNIRVHVARLGCGTRGDHDHREEDEEEETDDDDDDEEETDDDDDDVDGERHFPSRIRVWVGPEPGAAYATGPSLGRSTGNPEREVETTRTVKGSFASGGGPTKRAAGVKAKARAAARTRGRSWRWDQDAEGAAAVFEGVLCDFATGAEVATWTPGAGPGGDPRAGMRRRCGGPGRALTKAGAVVAAGDEAGSGGAVTWRVGREMAGRRVMWRVGGRFWATYFPNEVKSGYYESRWVEWREEVELHLVDATATEAVSS